MVKGHLDQQRSNIRSSKPKKLPDSTNPAEEETENE